MDVVYVLGPGSTWNDRELFYSLRSVARNLKGCHSIFVVGSKPRCPDPGVDYTFISADDPYDDKQLNVRDKLLTVCATPEIQDSFVLMNDDFFINQPVSCEAIPYYRSGTLKQNAEWREGFNPDAYWESMVKTDNQLRIAKLPATSFELHFPIVYTKPALSAVLDDFIFDWSSKRGLLIRSLYGNYMKYIGVVGTDVKIEEDLPAEEILSTISDKPFFSMGPGACTSIMEWVLNNRFPHPALIV